jgi:hypothetical protein
MIYILTGIAKSGKTYVAKKLLHDKAISFFSTDYLMMMLARAVPACHVDPDADDKIVARQLEPVLFAMIQTILENKTDYAIEGVHFTPEFAGRLIQAFAGQISVVFLGYQNASPLLKLREILDHAEEVGNDWVSAYSPENQIKTVRFLIVESGILAEQCRQAHLPYFDVTDIVRQADAIIGTLLNPAKV